jgi:hypothetical protein
MIVSTTWLEAQRTPSKAEAAWPRLSFHCISKDFVDFAQIHQLHPACVMILDAFVSLDCLRAIDCREIQLMRRHFWMVFAKILAS